MGLVKIMHDDKYAQQHSDGQARQDAAVVIFQGGSCAPASLLVVSFQRLGQGVMDDKAHIRLVDACGKGEVATRLGSQV